MKRRGTRHRFLRLHRLLRRGHPERRRILKVECDDSQVMLADLPFGARGAVACLHGGNDFISRMTALGFTPGAEVEVAQNEEHGPLLVIVRGARMALGRGAASKIAVKPLAGRPSPKPPSAAAPPAAASARELTVALAGQPN
jgi:ferrous iron transport protein A